MIQANINAQLEQLEKESYKLKTDIEKIQRLIDGLSKQKQILISNREDILYKIEELTDQEDDKLWQQ